MISPTFDSNNIYTNLRNLNKEEDVCRDPLKFPVALNQVVDRVKEAWKKYEEDKKYIKLYEKFQKTPWTLTVSEERILEDKRYEFPERPEKPSCCLILDDIQGSSLINDGKRDRLNQIIVSHRHIPLSIIVIAQSFKGVSRVLRLNATVVCVFKTSDKKELQDIYENVGNLITFEDFIELFKIATAKPHGFLAIDTETCDENKMFRNGFDEFLEIDKK